ncbi:endonuclease [Hydrogenophaga taeniospiralis CCUG 15921]|uniref:Endonuclease n=1 Tax=Hydrogenophaga taeniospiralis CCUG 15921 TaxID=1281780 RepID=A0A9X4SB19_9BURK|nr:Z1 domain-containing protein [Hydrogenophaga taeniospiralis]MDG5974853.1 endonuclease [Hydrogenophaga taeniospiralis CCUG 15921]
MNDKEKQFTDVVTVAQTLLRKQKEKGDITPLVIKDKVILAAGMLGGDSDEPFDVDRAIQELVRRFSHWIGKDASLQDDEGHIQWLNAARKKDWRYWQRYQTFLEKKMSVEVVGALDESTDNILGRLEDPVRKGVWDRRGLVVGHVQSGKTASYTGLVCKAADAGYKIIIVLAGLHNNLRAQTQIRLEEGFLGYETSASRDPGKPIGVAEIDSDPSIHPHCATTRADNGDFRQAVAAHFAISPEERPWLFVVKKQKTVLTQLLKWIQNHVADTVDKDTKRRLVTKLPLLVIDDEADNASVDTGEQVIDDNGNPDEEHQPKTINSLIRKILHAFERKAYVGYTATPFANIFIHRQGETKDEGPDLYPKAFIINLAAPSNYVGPAKIFGLSTPEGRTEGLPLMRPIDDHINKETPGGWMPVKHSKEHVPLFNGQEAVPTSLRKAIQAFALACAARELRGQGNEHSSMLVHVTRLVQVQKHVTAQVENALRKLKQGVTRGTDPSLIIELQELWETDFAPTTQAVSALSADTDGPYPPLSWKDIADKLPDVLEDIAVRMINGSAKDALDYAQQTSHGLKVIAVGGDKLSRGLTLEGLCTSYFVRTTKMYDTLMQMGRWFGYRPGYVDLCRLYTTHDLVEWFGHIADASEELRAEFDDMAERGATPMDYGLKVQSHPVMLVTSPLKMRTSKPLLLSFSGEVLETVSLHTETKVLNKNLETTNRLIERMGAPVKGPVFPLDRGELKQQHKGWLWESIPVDHIAEFFDGYLTRPESHKVNSKLLSQFIKDMAGKGELTSWTVYLAGGSGGNPATFHGGLLLESMLTRTTNTEKLDRYSFGRLLSPRDEAIDMSFPAWEAALAHTRAKKVKTDAAVPQDGDVKQPDSPSGPSIRKIKGEGAAGVLPARDRGLLLLYPLDPSKSESQNPELLSRTTPAIGIGVCFPVSNAGVKVEYLVDHKYWSEYGASE